LLTASIGTLWLVSRSRDSFLRLYRILNSLAALPQVVEPSMRCSKPKIEQNVVTLSTVVGPLRLTIV